MSETPAHNEHVPSNYESGESNVHQTLRAWIGNKLRGLFGPTHVTKEEIRRIRSELESGAIPVCFDSKTGQPID